MELEKATLSLSSIAPACITIVLGVWALVKVIFNSHKKDYEKHKEDYETFKKEQILENGKNHNHRHKYDKFDQTVNQLVAQTERSLSEKIDNSIASLSRSVETISSNVNLILTHLLKK